VARVKTNVARKKRVKRVLKATEGQWGARSKRYRHAKISLTRAYAYSYRDRKVKKRDFRKLWIARINAASRLGGITYSRFIQGLKKAEIMLDRKSLAELAVNDIDTFNRLIEIVKS